MHPGLEEFSIGYHVHSNELHNYGEKTKVEGTSKMECARYGFRIDRKTSIGCFTKNGHDMVVIEDIGLDGKKFEKGSLMDYNWGFWISSVF